MSKPQESPAAAPAVPAGVRRPALERALVGLLLVVLSGLGAAGIWAARATLQGRRTQPPPASGVLVMSDAAARTVPDFSLVDQQGRAVTRDDLKGQVWVADFFFTHCPAQCPMMTERMAKLQRVLPQGAPVKLVSITVDPEQDSPEVLAEYAKKYGAEEGRWIFLTGDKQAIIRLANEGFLLPAGDNPNDHSLRLTLVDRSGRIRGYYDSSDDRSVAELQRRLKELAAAE